MWLITHTSHASISLASPPPLVVGWPNFYSSHKDITVSCTVKKITLKFSKFNFNRNTSFVSKFRKIRFYSVSAETSINFLFLGTLLAREWTKFNYGVFSESGFAGDVLYPATYSGTVHIVLQARLYPATYSGTV